MKKLLCSLLSASLIAASLAVPVFADYTAAEYDIVDVNNAAEQVCGATATKVFTTSIDTTKEFYLGFDFKFDAATGSSIEIKSNASSNNTGPILTISDKGQLQTQTGSKSYSALGAVTAGTWYRAEIEGKTGDGSNLPTFRLYDAAGTLIQETPKCNMRNLGSNSRVINYMQATNVSIKNIKLVEEKPDTIELTADSDEIEAGSQLEFDYTMKRGSVEMTKYAVTYEVYNADDTALLNNDAVTITKSGVLQVAGTLAADTNVTVRASATFGEKTLVGTKAISLKAVDVSGEVFDTISISGDDTVKAGTDTTYTASTSKGGNPVTPDDGEVVWKVYDNTGVRELKWVTVADGVLSVPAGTIPQNVILRASSTTGVISASKTIAIEWADSDKETHHWYNSCDADMNGAEIVASIDGSGAYKLSSTWSPRFGGKSGYTFTEFDIKFPTSGTGLNFCRNDGGSRSVDVTSDGTNIKEYGGQVFGTVDPDAWYHVEIAFSTESDASCNVYKYDEDGVLGEPVTKLQINKRNNGQHGGIDIFGGTIIDNIKVTAPIADAISLSAAHLSMFPTEENQITATVSKKGLPITADGVEWSVLDATNKPIIDNSITIDNAGLMKASAMAPEGFVTVQAKTATTSDTVRIEIKSNEIFVINNIGINEDGDKVVKLYVTKKLSYDDDVVFVMAFYDENKSLMEVRTLKGYGSNYTKIGEDTENEIAVDWAIPSGFDKTTGEAKVFIWTSF